MAFPWKLLVYIAADTSLYDDAQVSLREITAASLFSDVKTIVQVDGPDDHISSRYECAQGKKQLIWEAPDNYTPDRSQRLADFLADSAPPMDQHRLFLVLWGHGAGLDHVYFYDQPTQPEIELVTPTAANAAVATNTPTQPSEDSDYEAADVLNVGDADRYVNDTSLASVLENFSASIGKKIDLLGFDACLMAMVEVWQQISQSTALVVGSDEELPKGSWPYATILSDLARFPGMDNHTLAAVVVSRFIEDYSKKDHRTRVSLAAFDLSATDDLAAAMTSLVEALRPLIGTGTLRRKILRARDSSRTPDEYTYIDLGSFCNELINSFVEDKAVVSAAQKVLEVLLSAPYIVYHRDSGESEALNSYGIAIYFPQVLSPTSKQLNTRISNLVKRAQKAADKKDASGIKPRYRVQHFPQPGEVKSGEIEPLGDGKKFYPVSRKFYPSGAKFYPSGRKVVQAGGQSSPSDADDNPITGYEILWDHYEKMDFSELTHWSNLISEIIKLGY